MDLLETAVQALFECPEGYLDGSHLSAALRERNPTQVAEALELAASTSTAGNSKGWLKRLVATDPRIAEVMVTNRREPIYCLAENAEVAAQAAAVNGTKRSAERALGPEGKKARTTQRTGPPADPGSVSEMDKSSLIMEVMLALQEQPWMEGNRLSKILSDKMPELTERVRSALGGKGWLKRLFENEPNIRQVEVQGRNEPCYQIADPSGNMPTVPLIAPPSNRAPRSGSRPGGNRNWTLPLPFAPARPGSNFGHLLNSGYANPLTPAGGNLQVKTEPGEFHSGPPPFGELGCPGRGNGSSESRGAAWARQWKLQRRQQILQQLQLQEQQRQQQMQQMQYALMGEEQQGGMDALEDGVSPMNVPSELAPHVEMMKAALIEAAIAALEGDPQTGYLEGSHLSSLLTEVHGEYVGQVKEALGGKGWLKQLFRGDGRITNIMVEGKGEPCYCLTGRVPEFATVIPYPTGGGRVGMSPQAMPTNMPSPETLVEYAVDALHTVAEYIEGNKLSKILRDTVPGLATAMPPKGWLRKLLEGDPRVAKVNIPGINEPCYCLAVNRHLAPVAALPRVVPPPQRVPSQSRNRNMAERLERKPSLSAQEVMEKLGTQDWAALTNLAVTLLQLQSTVEAEPQYIVGNQMSTLLQKDHPELVASVKTALGGKGWLKNLLQLDDRVQQVYVGGLGEPCWGLAPLRPAGLPLGDVPSGDAFSGDVPSGDVPSGEFLI